MGFLRQPDKARHSHWCDMTGGIWKDMRVLTCAVGVGDTTYLVKYTGYLGVAKSAL